MKGRIRILTVFLLCCLCFTLAPESPLAKTRFITIGTGGVTGVYYPVGGAISRLMNEKHAKYGLKVTVEATGGSVFNINALTTGDMEFATAQADKATQAWTGQSEWARTGPRKKLRSVFMLHTETVNLVASVDSGIKTCPDLKGKIVAIGNPGSGTRQNALDALSLCGLTEKGLAKAEEIKPAEAAGLLQDSRIDAYFYTVGHPNGSIKEAASGRIKVRLVPFPNLDELQKEKPYYVRTTVPVSMYPGIENKEDVAAFGVRACLLTSQDVPADVVYAITREVFDNIDTIKSMHPAFADLTKEEMVKGLPVTVHPGAMKFYEEAGLTRNVSTLE